MWAMRLFGVCVLGVGRIGAKWKCVFLNFFRGRRGVRAASDGSRRPASWSSAKHTHNYTLYMSIGVLYLVM